MGSGGWGWDARQGLRAVRSRPGASLTVIATVAVAIGLTTAVFSVVRGVLLEPLPYPGSERLAQVWQTKGSWMDSPSSQLRAFAERFPLSVPTFNDWTGEDTGFEALGAWTNRSPVHPQADGAEILRAQAATSGVFEALGVEAHLGRTLLPEDDGPGAPRVAVLSHELWQERYASQPSALGTDLVLDGIAHAIVGVMPPGFRLPDGPTRLWMQLSEEDLAEDRDSQFLTVVGRIPVSGSLEVAAERLAAVQGRLAETYPDEQGDVGSRVVGLLDAVVGEVRSTLWFLLGAVGLVLVIAVVNITNILSVTGLTRRKELAVKAALGAGAGRLVRGLLAESAVLAGIGGLLGIALAWLSLPLLLRLVPATVPRYEAIDMDMGVLAFGLAVTAVTALLVGTLPALHAARARPQEMMSESGRGLAGGRTGARVRAVFVVTEVALAFVLLVGAGLLGNSFARLWSVDRGFASEGLITVSAYPDPAAYPERDDRDLFVRSLRERMAAIPGAEVTATNQAPLSGSTSSTTYQLDRGDVEPEDTNVLISVVLENYFDVMGIPVLEGRGFEGSDVREAPGVAVVNESAARALWPGESPLGKRLRGGDEAPWITVVGLARNVRHQGLAREPEPKLYVPVWQSARHPTTWVLRASGDLAGVTELARRAVAGISPTTPIQRTQILEETIARSVAVPRFRTFFVVGLAVLAGLMALLGVYGVVTFSVAQRTREIGVRMALGARAPGLVARVVASGLALAVGGIAVGLVVAWATADVLEGFLYGVEPTDLPTYAWISVAVALVACGAAWLPARRAAAVDPVSVLSSE